MPKVALEPIAPDRRPTLEAMLQLYTHDFSEYWAGQDRGELSEFGQFDPYPELDRYWCEQDRSAWFIRSDGNLAGFALLSGHSHSGLPVDFDVSEFFVVRKHRGSGVGFEAARQLIMPRSGQWEIAVVRANVGAQSFWRRVTAGASAKVEAHDLNDERWNGSILRFQVA